MKITFLGAGSSIFAKNVLGDIMHTQSIKDIDMALYDIDGQRLDESYDMLCNILRNTPRKDVKIKNLTPKKIFLMTCPVFVLKFFIRIQPILIKYGLRNTFYK